MLAQRSDPSRKGSILSRVVVRRKSLRCLRRLDRQGTWMRKDCVVAVALRIREWQTSYCAYIFEEPARAG